ncbi:MAG: transglutaminase-like domain-containing protein [Alphaproteobacteria bacterium]|nr:transglutaminase-like domain-containing protein [Alphaproteobacteria bacterium]
METTDQFLDQLKAIGQAADAAIPLAETALILAALDHAGTDLAPYRAHLDQIVEDARSSFDSLRRGMTENEAAARVLADTIGVRHGYVGDNATFDDPQNADLIKVIDRRRGLPVSLGIIYLDIAHRLGLQARGLNTPGHFLLALGQGDHAKIVDPFNGGVVLSAEELQPLPPVPEGEAPEYGPVERRDVLLRLLNNIRTRALAGKDMLRALTIAERMVLIAPRRSELWLDLARACEGVGKLNSAIRAAQSSVSISGAQSAVGREATFVLQNLKRQLN